MKDKIIGYGAVAAALTAIAAVWIAIGGPLPATSADIQKLDARQTDIAIEVFNQKVRSIIVQAPANPSPQSKQLFEEELSKARRDLQAAEKRKIELSK